MDALLIGSQIFAGIVQGMILVLMAIGLSLIFGMMRVINFAHGAFYMLGAYTTYTVVSNWGGYWPALVIVPLVAGLFAYVIELFTIRPLYARPEEDPILLTFGLSLVLMEVVRMVFGKVGLPVNIPAELQGTIRVARFDFPVYLIFVVIVSITLIVLLWLFLEKTNTGLIVRAGTHSPETVQILGLDLQRARRIVFLIGVVMAALAGALSAPLRGVIPDMGQGILAPSFVVVVIGGMGSYWGTLVSGLTVGVTVALTSLFAPAWSEVALYILMAIVLVVKPDGLFAGRTRLRLLLGRS